MSKVLPTIEMPKPSLQQEPEPDSSANEPLSDNVLPESGDGNMDLIDDIMASKSKVESENKDDIITVEERDIPKEDDVFGDAPAPRVTPLQEEFTPSAEPKKGKRKYTRKAPMSEKQKEHLARIRKIAIEKRKAEKERKIKEKEEAVIAKAEKKILEKQRKKEKEEQEAINSSTLKLKKEPVPDSVVQQNGFTKQDLDNAVLSAISQYDSLRKQQKKEKREAEKKRLEEEKMRATLARAIQPQQAPVNDPWRNLFT